MTDSETEELLTEYCQESPLDNKAVLDEWRANFLHEDQSLRIGVAKGCDTCSGSGYRGRVGVHELLVNNREIRKLIARRGNVSEIQEAAILNGMRTLKQDGIEKMLQGVTDIHQVRAVCN